MKIGVLKYDYKDYTDEEDILNTILEKKEIDPSSIISIIPPVIEESPGYFGLKRYGIIYYRKGM